MLCLSARSSGFVGRSSMRDFGLSGTRPFPRQTSRSCAFSSLIPQGHLIRAGLRQVRPKPLGAQLVPEQAQGPKADDSRYRVRFIVPKYITTLGQNLAIVGDCQDLGDWNLSSAVLMRWAPGHSWTAEVEMPMDNNINFKVVLLRNIEGSVECVWEPGENRILNWKMCDAECKETLDVVCPWGKPLKVERRYHAIPEQQLQQQSRTQATETAPEEPASVMLDNNATESRTPSQRTGEKSRSSVPCRIVVPAFAPRDGGRLVLVGSLPELGSWKLEKGVELTPGPSFTWFTQLHLPVRKIFNAKLVHLDERGNVQWEQGYNRPLFLDALSKSRATAKDGYLILMPYAITSCNLIIQGSDIKGGMTDVPSSVAATYNFVVPLLPTSPGQSLILVGSAPELGAWDPLHGLQMKWLPQHVWRGAVELSGLAEVEAKVVLSDNGHYIWEPGPNRKLWLWQTSLGNGELEALQHFPEDPELKGTMSAGSILADSSSSGGPSNVVTEGFVTCAWGNQETPVVFVHCPRKELEKHGETEGSHEGKGEPLRLIEELLASRDNAALSYGSAMELVKSLLSASIAANGSDDQLGIGKKLDELQQQERKTLMVLQQQHQSELQSVKSSYEAQQDELRAILESKLERVVMESNTIRKHLQKELESVKREMAANAQRDLRNLQAQHTVQLEAVAAASETQESEQKTIMQQLEAEHETQLSKMIAQNEANLREVEAQAVLSEDKLRQQLSSAIREANAQVLQESQMANFRSAAESAMQPLVNEVLAFKDKQLQEQEQLLRRFEADAKELQGRVLDQRQQLQSSEATTSELRAELSSMSQEVEALEASSQQLGDEIAEREKSLRELEQKPMQLQLEIDEGRRHLNEAFKETKRLSAMIEQKEEAIRNLESMLTSSQESLKERDAATSALKIQISELVAGKQAEEVKVQNTTRELTSAQAALQEALGAQQTLEKEVLSLRSAVTSKDEALARATLELEQLRGQVEEKQAALSDSYRSLEQLQRKLEQRSEEARNFELEAAQLEVVVSEKQQVLVDAQVNVVQLMKRLEDKDELVRRSELEAVKLKEKVQEREEVMRNVREEMVAVRAELSAKDAVSRQFEIESVRLLGEVQERQEAVRRAEAEAASVKDMLRSRDSLLERLGLSDSPASPATRVGSEGKAEAELSSEEAERLRAMLSEKQREAVQLQEEKKELAAQLESALQEVESWRRERVALREKLGEKEASERSLQVEVAALRSSVEEKAALTRWLDGQVARYEADAVEQHEAQQGLELRLSQVQQSLESANKKRWEVESAFLQAVQDYEKQTTDLNRQAAKQEISLANYESELANARRVLEERKETMRATQAQAEHLELVVLQQEKAMAALKAELQGAKGLLEDKARVAASFDKSSGELREEVQRRMDMTLRLETELSQLGYQLGEKGRQLEEMGREKEQVSWDLKEALASLSSAQQMVEANDQLVRVREQEKQQLERDVHELAAKVAEGQQALQVKASELAHLEDHVAEQMQRQQDLEAEGRAKISSLQAQKSEQARLLRASETDMEQVRVRIGEQAQKLRQAEVAAEQAKLELRVQVEKSMEYGVAMEELRQRNQVVSSSLADAERKVGELQRELEGKAAALREFEMERGEKNGVITQLKASLQEMEARLDSLKQGAAAPAPEVLREGQETGSAERASDLDRTRELEDALRRSEALVQQLQQQQPASDQGDRSAVEAREEVKWEGEHVLAPPPVTGMWQRPSREEVERQHVSVQALERAARESGIEVKELQAKVASQEQRVVELQAQLEQAQHTYEDAVREKEQSVTEAFAKGRAILEGDDPMARWKSTGAEAVRVQALEQKLQQLQRELDEDQRDVLLQQRESELVALRGKFELLESRLLAVRELLQEVFDVEVLPQEQEADAIRVFMTSKRSLSPLSNGAKRDIKALQRSLAEKSRELEAQRALAAALEDRLKDAQAAEHALHLEMVKMAKENSDSAANIAALLVEVNSNEARVEQVRQEEEAARDKEISRINQQSDVRLFAQRRLLMTAHMTELEKAVASARQGMQDEIGRREAEVCALKEQMDAWRQQLEQQGIALPVVPPSPPLSTPTHTTSLAEAAQFPLVPRVGNGDGAESESAGRGAGGEEDRERKRLQQSLVQQQERRSRGLLGFMWRSLFGGASLEASGGASKGGVPQGNRRNEGRLQNGRKDVEESKVLSRPSKGDEGFVLGKGAPESGPDGGSKGAQTHDEKARMKDLMPSKASMVEEGRGEGGEKERTVGNDLQKKNEGEGRGQNKEPEGSMQWNNILPASQDVLAAHRNEGEEGESTKSREHAPDRAQDEHERSDKRL